MALPLAPFLALGVQALPAIGLWALAGLLTDRNPDNGAPVPDPAIQQPPYDPPFLGGQCADNPSRGYFVRITRFYNPNLEQEYVNPDPAQFGNGVAINAGRSVSKVEIEDIGFLQRWKVTDNTGQTYPLNGFGGSNTSGDIPITDFDVGLFLYDYSTNSGVPDSCGNLPNPNDPVPPSIGGGSLVPLDDDNPELIYEGGIPAGVLGILAALKTIADGIKTIGDVLNGIKAIGDAIDKLRELFEEKEKEDPKAVKVWAGRWFEIQGDGGFSMPNQLIDGENLVPNYIQIEIEKFPKGATLIVGRKSPSFCPSEPLGYILPRAANDAYYDAIPIRFLRQNIGLPTDCFGASFNLLRYPNLKAKVRVFYASKAD